MDMFKNAFKLGLGALVITKEKVEEVVSELVKKGEVGQEESKKIISELVERGEESKKEIESQVEKIVSGLAEKLDIPTRKELNDLKSEIEKLRRKLGKKE